MDALRDGTVSVLIGQRPDEQVRLAIEALAEHALLGNVPPRKDHFMHMDILTRYNVEDY
jgi:ABC-type sugar transport system substrate-binding protein